MPRAARFAPVVAALAAAALAGGAHATSSPAHHASSGPAHASAGKAPAPAQRAADSDVVLGSAKAPVTMIEYASTTCPHCAAWDREVFPAFKRKYVDTGKVRYILRESPTDPEEWSEAAFVVARCAGSAKFLDVVEAFMAQQKVLYEDRNGPAWLMRGATVGGLTRPQVDACLKDKDGVKAMQARIAANDRAFNVQATPTFIINGKIAGDGEMTLAELDKAIDKASTPPPPLRGAQTPATQTPAAKPAAKPGAPASSKAKRKAD